MYTKEESKNVHYSLLFHILCITENPISWSIVDPPVTVVTFLYMGGGDTMHLLTAYYETMGHLFMYT